MQLFNIVNKIVPCDRTKPYIFISYSITDCEQVWKDVLEFQLHGYNVWLDEKNIDKNEATWTEEALKVATDENCKLIVLYVSIFSLTNKNCYQQLSKAINKHTLYSEETKFIAINTTPMDSVMSLEKISSTVLEETQRCVLQDFMNYFFDGNNARMFIRSENDTRRRLDYYEEILDSFPNSAKIYEDSQDFILPSTDSKDIEDAMDLLNLYTSVANNLLDERRIADTEWFYKRCIQIVKELVNKLSKS